MINDCSIIIWSSLSLTWVIKICWVCIREPKLGIFWNTWIYNLTKLLNDWLFLKFSCAFLKLCHHIPDSSHQAETHLPQWCCPREISTLSFLSIETKDCIQKELGIFVVIESIINLIICSIFPNSFSPHFPIDPRPHWQHILTQFPCKFWILTICSP